MWVDTSVRDDEAVLLRDGNRFHLGPAQRRRSSATGRKATVLEHEVPESEPGMTWAHQSGHRNPWREEEVFKEPSWQGHTIDQHPARVLKDAQRKPWRSEDVCEQPASPQQDALQDTENGSDVTLHVYDLTQWTRASNLPIFHLGVQVYRNEYFFCSLGIQTCLPGRNKGHIFKESVPLGRTTFCLRKVRAILTRLRVDWRMDSYRILGRNCQTFANTFCAELGLRDCVPAEYNRFSELENLGSHVASLVDGAAAMLPRMPERPDLLLACSMPKISDLDLCSQGQRAAPKPHAHVFSHASPREYRLEECAKSMNHCAAASLPHAARHARPESRGGA